MGSTLEASYFAFSGGDFVGITDMPVNAAAAGSALLVNTNGKANVKTTVLLTLEEIGDVATARGDYRPPGG